MPETKVERGYLLSCGCRAEKIIEEYDFGKGEMEEYETLNWWSACPGHEGASSGHILHLLNGEYPSELAFA